MEYRQLGPSGLKVSELSFGSWITFGADLDIYGALECMRKAFELGINFFDNAEVYGNGASEMLMGEALRAFPREQVVISTKIFWGGKTPNEIGLSWKHLVEGTKRSLKRLELDYVDLLYCHRPDPQTPIEETVRAMNYLIQAGLIFYWGTSEWSYEEIETACEIATQNHLRGPIVEQPQYNLFCRQRVEREYKPLYERYKLGITSWSPLDSGILTGKYNGGIPATSRLARHQWLQDHLTADKVEKVKQLETIAASCNASAAQLAIAWCLNNPRVSSVILGATSPAQLEHNVRAASLKHELPPELFAQLEQVFS